METAKPLILVVEDNRNQSEYMVDYINDTGLYEAIPAYDGAEALALLKEHEHGLFIIKNRIKCILLDWQMPGMSGEQFIRKLRNKEHLNIFSNNIPVVIVSAHSDPSRRKLAANPVYGRASAYLQKPFEYHEMIKCLEKIVIHNQAEYLRAQLATAIGKS